MLNDNNSYTVLDKLKQCYILKKNYEINNMK